MNKVIILVVIVVLLIGGSLGGMAVLGVGPFKDLGKKEKPVEAPPAPPKIARYPLGTFVIPLIQDHAIARQVAVDMEVEAKGDAAAAKVAGGMVRLRDAYLLELYDVVPRHSNPKSAEDKQAIREKLIARSNKILGEGAVSDVVIKAMYNR